MAPSLDLDFVRSHFPILKTGYIFADNAGGSQIAKDAADRMYDYLLNTNVQLGADYSMSVKSTNKVLVEAPQSATKLFNAKSEKEVVFGPSSTANMENLCRGMEVKEEVTAEHEIIITGEHEGELIYFPSLVIAHYRPHRVVLANAGPWKKLAKRVGATIKFWHAKPTNPENPYSIAHHVEDLLPLITSKTRIIAFTATSNILGSILPVREIVKAARAKAAEVGSKKVEFSIDCVAYAPHRLIDVQDWDVEYCVFSYYKVRLPHSPDSITAQNINQFRYTAPTSAPSTSSRPLLKPPSAPSPTTS
jgi:selenocysteine lyase/cysteine desulfurase